MGNVFSFSHMFHRGRIPERKAIREEWRGEKKKKKKKKKTNLTIDALVSTPPNRLLTLSTKSVIVWINEKRKSWFVFN